MMARVEREWKKWQKFDCWLEKGSRVSLKNSPVRSVWSHSKLTILFLLLIHFFRCHFSLSITSLWFLFSPIFLFPQFIPIQQLLPYFIYKLIYIILYNSLFWFIFTKYLLIHNLNLIVFLVLIIHLFSREREGINLGFDSYIKDIFYMPIQLYLLFLTKIQLYLAM